jgi:hypothetical protein
MSKDSDDSGWWILQESAALAISIPSYVNQVNAVKNLLQNKSSIEFDELYNIHALLYTIAFWLTKCQ